MDKLRLPRLLSDGMVLQQGKKIHIWGWDEPGSKLKLFFDEETYAAVADENGSWEFWLEGRTPGGPYTMQICDEEGEERKLTNILVGDVFVCSGQSNMDIPMARVRDRYPEEIINCVNFPIRTFKMAEHGAFHAPLKDHVSGQWWQADSAHILDFSATAYFFAKHLYQLTGVPVGLIHASLGGSRIESWMSREMIQGEAPYSRVENFVWDEKSGREAANGYRDRRREYLETIERYDSAEFVAGQLRRNEEQSCRWHEELDNRDAGLKEHWEREGLADEDWDRMILPCMFRDTALKGFVGSLWLRRDFEVTKELAERGFTDREKMLWLGTMVDSDTVYVNGQQVGHTDYQYPPRKYFIPAGLLHLGKNQITIHLKCEKGEGRVTPGKEYKIFDGICPAGSAFRKPGLEQDIPFQDETSCRSEIPLNGEWKYRIGAVCRPAKETDFVNWKPAALYNGMMAPNHPYTISGIIWYQGEANTHAPENYLDSMKRLIGGYREQWRDEKLPFYYVQLPNFQIDLPPQGSGWREIRQQQRQAQQLPHVGMAVAIDLGEDNDLHPLNKEDVGKRLALLAAADLYGKPVQSRGPEPEQILVTAEPAAIPEAEEPKRFLLTKEMERPERENGKQAALGWKVTIKCRDAKELYAYSAGKGDRITDFELVDRDGNSYPARAEIDKNLIILHCRATKSPIAEVRYCYHDTNSGALLYNEAGLPMSPFLEKTEKWQIGGEKA